MIFDTLAAMADYRNNLKFDLTATTAECRAELVLKNDAGSLTLKTETLSVDSISKNVADKDKIKYFMRGMLAKTPLQSLDADMKSYA